MSQLCQKSQLAHSSKEASSFHAKYLIVTAVQSQASKSVAFVCSGSVWLVGWSRVGFWGFVLVLFVGGFWWFWGILIFCGCCFCLFGGVFFKKKHFPPFLPDNHYTDPLSWGLSSHSTVLDHTEVFSTNMQEAETRKTNEYLDSIVISCKHPAKKPQPVTVNPTVTVT